ncbi:helix-turn-helix domain-containing protein [Arthrobacter sp. TMN-49]
MCGGIAHPTGHLPGTADPEQTFYQWRVKRLGPRAHRIGRHLRISRSDLNEWLATTEAHFT